VNEKRELTASLFNSTLQPFASTIFTQAFIISADEDRQFAEGELSSLQA